MKCKNCLWGSGTQPVTLLPLTTFPTQLTTIIFTEQADNWNSQHRQSN